MFVRAAAVVRSRGQTMNENPQQSASRFVTDKPPASKMLLDTAVVLAVLMIFTNALVIWRFGRKVPGIDFYQFWVAGRAAKDFDVDNIYTDYFQNKIGAELSQRFSRMPDSPRLREAAQNRKTLRLLATPFLYTLFTALSTGNYEIDIGRFQVVSMVSALVAVAGLCLMQRYSSAATAVALLLCLGWYQPFVADTSVANVNRLQFALLAAALWFLRKPGWHVGEFVAGMVIGLAVMFKPNLIFVPAMLIVSWLVNRRYGPVLFGALGMLSAIVVAFVWSSAFFGSPRCWYNWLIIVKAPFDSFYAVREGNFAFALILAYTLSWNVIAYLWALLTAVAVGFVWISRRRPDRISQQTTQQQPGLDRGFLEDLIMVATGCLIYLLSAPLVWVHYFVLALPIVFVIFRPQQRVDGSFVGLIIRRTLAGVALVGLASESVFALFESVTFFWVALVQCTCTLILFVLALCELFCLRKNTQYIIA